MAGDALLTALAADFSPATTFSYDRARDSLFATVYLETGDSLRCRYSGLAVYIDPALDPTTAAWNASPRVSTEHLWPQNRGATEGTPAHADLHHLVPAQQSINSSRSDHPFGEVDDTLADRWWGPTPGYATTPPPLVVRDRYSEKDNAGDASLFEPRESVAGDVARAMFYVWTVYGPSGTNQLGTAFWATQRSTLLDWHAEDPPDSAEVARSLRIATWQGTPNPFVLDTTLATRAFAPLPAVASVTSFVATQTAPGTAAVSWTTTAELAVATFHVDGRPDVFGSTWTLWGSAPAAGVPSAYTLSVEGLALGDYRVRLRASAPDSPEATLGDIALSISGVTDGADAPARPALTLGAPSPNPASRLVHATLTLAHPAHVVAVVTDVLGRQVAVLHDGPASGSVALVLDAARLPPGVYTLRATAHAHGIAPVHSATRRFTVLR